MDIIRREYNGALLFERKSRNYFYISEEYTKVLDKIHEGQRISDSDLIHDLRDIGLIEVSNYRYQISDHYRYIKKNIYTNGRLIAPIIVFLQVTNRCNMRCKHCFTGEKRVNDQAELTTDEILSLIAKLQKVGVCEVVIGGGEPLCRDDILIILKTICQSGMLPSITTNGTLLTNNFIEEIKKIDMGYVKVSLDGNYESNDYIRGIGNYQRSIVGIKKLIENNIDVGVRMTINGYNFRDIYSLYTNLLQIGCKSMSFSTIRPSGNAKVNRDLFEGLIGENYEIAMNQILLIKKEEKMKISLSEDAPFISSLNENSSILPELLPQFGCPLKGTVCEIDAHGDVSVCGFLRGLIGSEAVAGNIRYDDIENLWNSSPVFGRFAELNIPEKCNKCKRKNVCHGGCRTRALYKYNSFDAHDPLCYSFEEMEK